MRHLLVMGVCGTGKSTVAKAVSEEIGAGYIEADAYHSPEAVALMRGGHPLTDDHRWGWLDRIGSAAAAMPGRGVIACSALKAAYRDRLSGRLGGLAVVHLYGEKALLAERMAARGDHFMPASLLDSQFGDLEPPAGPDVLAIDVALEREIVVRKAREFAHSTLDTT